MHPATTPRSPRIRRLVGRLRRRAPVDYRHGIRNRADEIVAEDPWAGQLHDAGILTMGDYSFRVPAMRMFAGDRGSAQVGKYTAIAEGVQFFVGGAHRSDWVSQYGFRIVFDLPGAFTDGTPASRGDISVGSDCWLASECVVLSGVTIGDGAVVANRAVVTRDVRPYAVVAGNPAREVRRRFPDDQVDALLRIRWWDWPVERVLDHVDDLCSPDLAGFIDRFDRD